MRRPADGNCNRLWNVIYRNDTAVNQAEMVALDEATVSLVGGDRRGLVFSCDDFASRLSDVGETCGGRLRG